MRRIFAVLCMVVAMNVVERSGRAEDQHGAPANETRAAGAPGTEEAVTKEGQAAESPPWKRGSGLMSEVRMGAQVGLRGAHLKGAALELSLGHQFGFGLGIVADLAFSHMFPDDTAEDDLRYLRAGLGLRWTFDTGRVRPWVQVAGGYHVYSLVDDDGDAVDGLPGAGLSTTAGVDIGAGHVGPVQVWLGLSGGVDVGFFDGFVDLPARSMLTLTFHRT